MIKRLQHPPLQQRQFFTISIQYYPTGLKMHQPRRIRDGFDAFFGQHFGGQKLPRGHLMRPVKRLLFGMSMPIF